MSRFFFHKLFPSEFFLFSSFLLSFSYLTWELLASSSLSLAMLNINDTQTVNFWIRCTAVTATSSASILIFYGKDFFGKIMKISWMMCAHFKVIISDIWSNFIAFLYELILEFIPQWCLSLPWKWKFKIFSFPFFNF